DFGGEDVRRVVAGRVRCDLLRHRIGRNVALVLPGERLEAFQDGPPVDKASHRTRIMRGCLFGRSNWLGNGSGGAPIEWFLGRLGYRRRSLSWRLALNRQALQCIG